MRRTISVAIIALLFGRCALSADPPSKPEGSDQIVTIAKGNNQFATDLYAAVSSDKTTNLFFSPFSVSTALSMVYAGANGQTKTEIANLLHNSMPEAEFHAALNALQKSLSSSDEIRGFQLRVANRLWGQEGFQFLPAYLALTKSEYGAELGLLDFKKSELARTTINSWVEKQTENKIQNLLPPGLIGPDMRLVLTNAIYFKARWQDQFHKNQTNNAPFYVAVGKEVAVPTMHQTEHFRYAETTDAKLLELPYSGEGDMSLLIVLPKSNDGLAAVEKQFSSTSLSKWCESLQRTYVAVSLPKFKLTQEINLGETLKSMGMPLAFSNQADLSRMSTSERLSISSVVHKAFIDLNEEGTEAAAATAIGIRALAIPVKPKDPIQFKADHPFLFVIRDQKSESILFIGRMANPF